MILDLKNAPRKRRGTNSVFWAQTTWRLRDNDFQIENLSLGMDIETASV
jgi:hypothetical protein